MHKTVYLLDFLDFLFLIINLFINSIHYKINKINIIIKYKIIL